jgi:polyisoprenoid-binding protein YceI
VFNRIAITALALTLASCVIPRHRPPAPRPPPKPSGSVSLPPPGTYAIDSNGSELRLLVYRAGPLAALGHNHVVVSHAVTGLVQVGGSVAQSSFSLRVPVESFVVDESQARREEGDDFQSDIPPDAKLGTRRNMLSEALLDAAHYPTITVTSMTLSGTPEAPMAELSIHAAGHEAKLSAPFILQVEAHRVMATGAVELRQSDLGLTPYSLLHGALQVEDAMQLKFSLAVPIS